MPTVSLVVAAYNLGEGHSLHALVRAWTRRRTLRAVMATARFCCWMRMRALSSQSWPSATHSYGTCWSPARTMTGSSMRAAAQLLAPPLRLLDLAGAVRALARGAGPVSAPSRPAGDTWASGI